MTDKQSPSGASAGLLRLPDVLRLYPVSRSAWYQGIKEGKHPAPLKLAGGRTAAWRLADVLRLIDASQTA
jgi:prophage regulatory protein